MSFRRNFSPRSGKYHTTQIVAGLLGPRSHCGSFLHTRRGSSVLERKLDATYRGRRTWPCDRRLQWRALTDQVIAGGSRPPADLRSLRLALDVANWLPEDPSSIRETCRCSAPVDRGK